MLPAFTPEDTARLVESNKRNQAVPEIISYKQREDDSLLFRNENAVPKNPREGWTLNYFETNWHLMALYYLDKYTELHRARGNEK